MYYEVRGEGLMWLTGPAVYLPGASLVQLFTVTCNGWPLNAL